MSQLLDYLKQAVEDKASDLFIVAGSPVCEKLDKQMVPLSNDRALPQDTEAMVTELYQLAKRPMDAYVREGDDDFSFSAVSYTHLRAHET